MSEGTRESFGIDVNSHINTDPKSRPQSELPKPWTLQQWLWLAFGALAFIFIGFFVIRQLSAEKPPFTTSEGVELLAPPSCEGKVTKPYRRSWVNICRGDRYDYLAEMPFPFDNDSCVEDITDEEWAVENFSYDPKKPKFLTWAKQMDWANLCTIQQYYSKMENLYKVSPDVGRMDDKVWLTNNFSIEQQIPVSPVLYARKRDVYYSKWPKSGDELWEAVEECRNGKGAFVVKPSHLESGQGIFYFDSEGGWHGQFGHPEKFKRGVLEGWDELTDMRSNFKFKDRKELEKFLKDLGDGQAADWMEEQTINDGKTPLRDIAFDKDTLLKLVDCVLMTKVVSADAPGILIELVRPQDELRIFVGLGKIWGHLKTWGAMTGGFKRFSHMGPDYNVVETWSYEDYEAAKELALDVARKTNVDLIRVDVCKYGNVVRNKFPKRYGSHEESGREDKVWNTQGVFLSEFTLIMSHKFEWIPVTCQHIYAEYFSRLVEFWHKPENLKKLGYKFTWES